MADYQTELSQSGTTLYLKPADGFQRSTIFGDSGANTHHFTGSVYVSGTLHANEYRVNQIDTISGSTIFGNSSGDTHQFTGSAYMANDLYVVGTIFGGSPVKIGGGMSVSGTLDMSGSTDFGSEASHNHIFTGSILQTGSGGTNHFRDSNVFGTNTNTSTHQFTGSVFSSNAVTVTSGDMLIQEGNLSASSNLDLGGAVTALGNLNISGSTILGNAPTDSHHISGSVRISGSTHILDNERIYFGTGDDISLRYYSDGSRLVLDGDLQFEDDKKLRFGAGSDVTMEYDEDGTDQFRIVGFHTTIDNSGGGTFTVTGSTTLVGNLTSNNGALKVESSGMGGTSAILTGSLTLHNGGITLKDEQSIAIGDGTIVVDSANAPYSMVLSPDDGVNFTQQAKASNKLIVSAKNNHTASVAFEVHYTGSHDPTTLANNTGGGEVVYFGSGSTTQGALHYLNDAGGWSTANASAVGSVHGGSGGGNESLLGIALGTNPNVDGMLINGFFDANTYFTGTWTAGKAVYMYAGAGGKMTATAPAASSNFVRIVGYATDTAKVIYLNPDSSWVVID